MSFITQWLYLLALSLWVGGIVFFSFLTTPALFSSLPREMTGTVLAVLFPRYYYLGYASGGILLAMTLLESALVRSLPWLRISLILIMLGSTCYAGMILRPKIHQLKIEMKAVEEDTPLGKDLKLNFDKLHRLSVVLNMVVLVGGLFLLGILAFRLRL